MNLGRLAHKAIAVAIADGYVSKITCNSGEKKLATRLAHKAIAVAMALMASTSLAGVSVHTGSNPCDVHAHGGAAVATAAPPCRAHGAPAMPRRRCFRAGRSMCLLPLEPQLLVRVGRLSSPLHGFPRRLEAGRQAALASPRHGGTARGGRCLARPRTGGGRYFIYRPPRVPVGRSISIQRLRLSKGGRVQAGC